jgi:hypothetical protein
MKKHVMPNVIRPVFVKMNDLKSFHVSQYVGNDCGRPIAQHTGNGVTV